MIIKEFDKKISDVYYEKSDNKDVIYKWSRSEIFLSGKENALDNQIIKDNEFIKQLKDNPEELVNHPKDIIKITENKRDNTVILLEKLEKL